MRFEKLNHNNLKHLQSKGYSLLISNNKLSDETIVWFPEKIDNLSEHLSDFDVLDTNAELEPSILLIQFAIDYMSEDELVGDVFNLAH